MADLEGRVVAVAAGGNSNLGKTACEDIRVGFDGIEGDVHAGPSRKAFSGEREAKGTVMRNDRQWSAVSVEELAEISASLDLREPLSPDVLGANLCIEGIPEFSLLPRGSRLKFPSGAALTVEEYNPPCIQMGAQIASRYTKRDGQALTPGAWLKPAAGRRGVVGVVDVPGTIHRGDTVQVELFNPPVIKRHDP